MRRILYAVFAYVWCDVNCAYTMFVCIATVGPCSLMLYIKNKTTQLLTIKGLRPSKHYLLLDIMIFRRRS
jgi:hypothetical protein